MKKRKFQTKRDKKEVIPVILEPYQITLAECGGSFSKAFKKFSKKCRNDEILKPLYDKLSYKSPGQKKRNKHQKAVFKIKKEERKKLLEEKNDDR